MACSSACCALVPSDKGPEVAHVVTGGGGPLRTWMRCFFASVTAFWTASTTSLAVAVPTPTLPFSSPITTTALAADTGPATQFGGLPARS